MTPVLGKVSGFAMIIELPNGSQRRNYSDVATMKFDRNNLFVIAKSQGVDPPWLEFIIKFEFDGGREEGNDFGFPGDHVKKGSPAHKVACKCDATQWRLGEPASSTTYVCVDCHDAKDMDDAYIELLEGEDLRDLPPTGLLGRVS